MKKILIIEDDPITARVYRGHLEKARYQVEVVPDGRQAIPRIQQFRPDGVLLDLMLPGLSGIEILKQLRAGGSAVPVVVCTNANVPKLVEDAKAAGANYVFGKAEMTPLELTETFRVELAKAKE